MKNDLHTLAMRLMLIAILSHCCILTFAQSVAINPDGAPPDSSAILDITSNTKGILVPRTSSISRTAITNPANGLIL